MNCPAPYAHIAAAPANAATATIKIRVGHGVLVRIVIFGDDTDIRRRQSRNFIELKCEVD